MHRCIDIYTHICIYVYVYTQLLNMKKKKKAPALLSPYHLSVAAVLWNI